MVPSHSPTRSLRAGFIQNEQEGFRLALMGDAVSVAASAVFFAVRLVDATFDLHVSSALNGIAALGATGAPQIQLESISIATEKYRAFLEFKQSEELRSMAISLVLPLLFMRVVGSLKDAAYSFVFLADASNTPRKVLDAVDCFVLFITASFALRTIPPLEAELVRLSGGQTPWENTKMFEVFDELEFCHLVALAQAGLLLLVSLLKLSARLERSSVRIIERAEEFDVMENSILKQLEQSNEEAAKWEAIAEEAQMQQQQQGQQREVKHLALIPHLEEETISTGASTPLTSEEVALLTHSQTVVDESDTNLSMESDEFYKRRGWKRVALPRTPLLDTANVTAAIARMESYAPMYGDENKISAADVLLGTSVSVATFALVQYLHEPVVKLLKS